MKTRIRKRFLQRARVITKQTKAGSALKFAGQAVDIISQRVTGLQQGCHLVDRMDHRRVVPATKAAADIRQ